MFKRYNVSNHAETYFFVLFNLACRVTEKGFFPDFANVSSMSKKTPDRFLAILTLTVWIEGIIIVGK